MKNGILIKELITNEDSIVLYLAPFRSLAFEVEESLSLEDTEKELIKKALQKHKGKRKYAASELGISERTLYRKIKEYHLD